MKKLGINYSDELYEILQLLSVKNKVAKMLYDFNVYNTEIDYLDLSANGDTSQLSYLPSNKSRVVEENGDSHWRSSYRQVAKLGKILNKILAIDSVEVKESEIKEFVELFKSQFSTDQFQISTVSGKDMLPYFLESCYQRPGNNSELAKSCMRHPECQKWVEFYTRFPNLDMVIALDSDGKLAARSLIWNDITLSRDYAAPPPALEGLGDKLNFIDRIYSSSSMAKIALFNWGQKNCNLLHATPKNSTQFYIANDDSGVKYDIYLKQSFEKYKSYYYPYIDTCTYYSISAKELTNYSTHNSSWKFHSTDGTFQRVRDRAPSITTIRDEIRENSLMVSFIEGKLIVGSQLQAEREITYEEVCNLLGLSVIPQPEEIVEERDEITVPSNTIHTSTGILTTTNDLNQYVYGTVLPAVQWIDEPIPVNEATLTEQDAHDALVTRFRTLRRGN